MQSTAFRTWALFGSLLCSGFLLKRVWAETRPDYRKNGYACATQKLFNRLETFQKVR